MGGRGHRRPGRLAPDRGGRPLRRGRRRRRVHEARVRARRRGDARPRRRRSRRSPRSRAPCATAAARASSRSRARWERRRRRTSSARSAAAQARTVAAERSFNNEIGVPLTLCRLEPDTEICILEMSMRGFGQIAELCDVRAPAHRRDHEHRAGAPREGRDARRRRAREERVDRGAAAGRHGDRPGRLSRRP